MALERLFVEPRRIERAGRRHGGIAVLERPAAVDQRFGHRAIDQSGVEMAQAEMRRKAFSQGALAGGGRPIDGDDHACFEYGSVGWVKRAWRAEPTAIDACREVLSASSNPRPSV